MKREDYEKARSNLRSECVNCGSTQFQASPSYSLLCAECWQARYGSLDLQWELNNKDKETIWKRLSNWLLNFVRSR